jgi:hypothetical protein
MKGKFLQATRERSRRENVHNINDDDHDNNDGVRKFLLTLDGAASVLGVQQKH